MDDEQTEIEDELEDAEPLETTTFGDVLGTSLHICDHT